MAVMTIVFLVLALLCLLIGLLLSNAGSTGGLASLSGQDLEIFRKTKDRGITKILQVAMFMISIILIVISIVLQLI